MNALLSFLNYNPLNKIGEAQVNKFQLKRDTSTNWSRINPILYPGEIVIETDSSQFKIGTDANLKWNDLEYYSGGSITHGFLLPRLTTAQGEAISPQVEGLMYYNTDQHKPYVHEGSDLGWKGLQRQLLSTTNQITVATDTLVITDPFNIGVINSGPDTNIIDTFGKAKTGSISDVAFWSHYGNANITDNAISQNLAGQTAVNAKSGQTSSLSVHGTPIVSASSTGASVTGTVSSSTLTASQAVMTDANKKLISADYLDQAVKQASSPTHIAMILTQATGTKPLTITSTTKCDNLNADLWDGYEFATYLDQAVKQASNVSYASVSTAKITQSQTIQQEFSKLVNDAAATTVFTITLATEAATHNGGSLSCFLEASICHSDGDNDPYGSTKAHICSFSAHTTATGTTYGPVSAVDAILSGDESRVEGSSPHKSLGTIAVTVTILGKVISVNYNVDKTGTNIGNCVVRVHAKLIYNTYLTAPVMANA